MAKEVLLENAMDGPIEVDGQIVEAGGTVSVSKARAEQLLADPFMQVNRVEAGQEEGGKSE